MELSRMTEYIKIIPRYQLENSVSLFSILVIIITITKLSNLIGYQLP